MTATTPTCACCGKPLADGATVCHADALSLAQTLREAAGHAEDAWTVIARQARMGTAGGARQSDPEPAVAAEDLRRNPVTAFGWQASIERPMAGGLRPEPTPADLGALDRYHAAENTISTWARGLGADADGLPGACAWLAEHVEQLRTHPAADEAFRDLTDACGQLRRLVDSPPTKDLVGRCDCGRFLYAADGRTVVQCPEKTCQLWWEVAESRAILRKAIDDRLFTAAEAARLAVRLDDGDRSTEQVRKLINAWSARGQLADHGYIVVELEGLDEDGQPKTRHDPLFRFGDVADRLAATPRRNREGAAA